MHRRFSKCTVSEKDIFEAIDQIRLKKKKQLDIKGVFNYLTKMEKLKSFVGSFIKQNHKRGEGSKNY